MPIGAGSRADSPRPTLPTTSRTSGTCAHARVLRGDHLLRLGERGGRQQRRHGAGSEPSSSGGMNSRPRPGKAWRAASRRVRRGIQARPPRGPLRSGRGDAREAQPDRAGPRTTSATGSARNAACGPAPSAAPAGTRAMMARETGFCSSGTQALGRDALDGRRPRSRRPPAAVGQPLQRRPPGPSAAARAATAARTPGQGRQRAARRAPRPARLAQRQQRRAPARRSAPGRPRRRWRRSWCRPAA